MSLPAEPSQPNLAELIRGRIIIGNARLAILEAFATMGYDEDTATASEALAAIDAFTDKVNAKIGALIQ
jgi:hypothetical protein